MNGRTALHLALIASLTACAYPLTALLCVWDGKPVGLSAWGMAGLLALLLWLGLGGILLVRRISGYLRVCDRRDNELFGADHGADHD